ncbi:NAD+ diphosphatase [Clostridium acetobutylicum]|uniref:NAD(+) diphosphatase n=1 Tax=Clostridium acetobutylicum (strain ATCC 824 / DSM 792 / JCM 1419 / IAM 19013 / LMG 5710 / NBRC 13948 / NRRL B-527 / VKM B-1787 / 2291 / W) TaxID=272562 RepID=Q97DS6_CLOAB|nr:MULTISPECIES: NAD(+) diphosphatase [Clostridium]AAK81326.1 Nudix (MutT) family hydrolase, C4-type Zn-finger domain containing [Clostridium acetobutylicum ATCC 824]ADZ22436.1 Nudix (MutT) family hydrolase, C4-type Zn-finger domain containing protein [Clostridium acetobutylicum EA 2018]AEI34380.1 NUDIX family hydrolase [Clostridium acetobutylicum DSM 1731]AWV81007.1 NAD(+) diphosphatase [Clostridium acetobutylicum]MBC2395520.1 NAD(+) diphosphatase [Clostridium acetobutylicum]
MSEFRIISDVNRRVKNCDLCFAFFEGNVIVKTKNSPCIPSLEDVQKLKINYEKEIFLGEIGDNACFALELFEEIKLDENFEFMSLRKILSLMEEEIFLAAGRASEILNWDRKHRFCGRCGAKTNDKEDEIAKVCNKCGNIIYPVISPAIIVGIINKDKILLAHNSNFQDGMYALISGFVDAGENLESTVRREVFEEVGIRVKNIRYYNSSAWPFPDSLMLGFFAEYEAGDIKVDGIEITDAGWFSKDELPNIPGKGTIARRIIDEFIDSVK